MITYDDPKPIGATITAKRMLDRYKHSDYTPEERATDHAFSYDKQTIGRKFWIGVLQEICRMKQGINLQGETK